MNESKVICRTVGNFVAKWIELSYEGKCDTVGGAEFRRVLADFCIAGFPAAAQDFIISNANKVPDGNAIAEW